jgi:methylmalonyl-CoA epimerase
MLNLQAIDHVGIATPSLAEGLALYRDTLGLAIALHEVLEEQGVEVALLTCGGQHIELLAPIRPDSPVGKFLADRGAGIHHVAYRVPDLADALARCRESGLELVDQAPRRGAGGHLVAFLHPRSTGRALIELVEVRER